MPLPTKMLIACLLMATGLPAFAAERFQDWWISYSQPSGEQALTLLAYTRTDEGHALAVGQTQNGPVKIALLVNGGPPIHIRDGLLEAEIDVDTTCRKHALQQDPDAPIDPDPSSGSWTQSLEWPVWEPSRGHSLPPLLESLMEGREIRLKVEDDQGDVRTLKFSLDGARQAMQWILAQGPLTVTHHTVDTLSDRAAFECHQRARGERSRLETCFDAIVSCWDHHAGGSVLAFQGCLRNSRMGLGGNW
ncbi:hypothetical protein [Ectothiorhodospira shaposhnikovii]|uniref:hypothetical protein n=1 Tax=Ectothiorhodospira shaposhnikovii TaxID=1054 RepID=UPI001EE809F1|nr:hypothetical protein [Ectothiorhodospira shaposhnikovii]MCG5512974.1 hypothetical protein [Ectothiorhodospira shaposhnikovii]